jgi:predicted nuclease of restriction endonuclease-like (RecB) superfamily
MVSKFSLVSRESSSTWTGLSMSFKQTPIRNAARSKFTESDYGQWIGGLKERFRSVQLKAAVTVNAELLGFYWELGAEIVAKQAETNWGTGLLKQLSEDLVREFPGVSGFSSRNLNYIRQWVLFWNSSILQQPAAELRIRLQNGIEPAQEHNSSDQQAAKEFVQQPVGQIGKLREDELARSDELGDPIVQQPAADLRVPPIPELLAIPWGHHMVLLAKCKQHDEALFYVRATLEHGWSRVILVHQIETGLWQRKGQASTNFASTLPPAQSDLARQVLKDPYVFDFLSVTDEHNERELERDLVAHITQFLVELGAGFAFVGRQVPLQVGERDFFLDLLFYHVHLHCYVVVELKTVDFEPEFAGKLNFYLTAVDETMRSESDAPTIGLLLCKNKDGLVAEYALRDINKPMGVSTYTLSQMLPESLRNKLPSIEQLERELGLINGENHRSGAES